VADTPPTTSQSRRRPSNRALAAGGVIAAVVLALVLLVATTGSGDDEAATGSVSLTEPAEVTSDSTTEGAEDGSASEDDSTAEPTTSVGGAAAAPTTQEGDTATQPTRVGSFPSDSSPAKDDDAATTTSPTVDPGTGSATTIAGASPPTTTANASPPTTIVVTLPTTTAVVAPPTTTPTVPVSDGCAVVGTDDFDEVLIELTVTSSATAVALLEVGFVLSSGGEEIVADFIALEFMAPGERAQVIAETFETVPAGSDVSALSCAIDAVNEVDLFDNQVLPGPDDSCSVIGVDEVGDLQLTGTVRNPSPDTADLTFSFAVRDTSGVRVISDVGFADEVGPGQLTTQEVDTLVAPPPSLDVASLTCDIVGIDLF